MSPSHRQLVAWMFAVGLLSGTQGLAQQAPGGSPPDTARVAAAHRFLETGGMVDAMVAAMEANLPAQRAMSPQLPAEFWTRFEARIVRDTPLLVDSIAVLYARTFTRDELEQLAAFYRSPVGRRLRDLQPTLVSESSAIGQRWGSRIGAEIGASLQQH